MADDTRRPEGTGSGRPEGQPRRPYRRPTLTQYGSVAKLTQGTLTRQGESPGGGFKMTCL